MENDQAYKKHTQMFSDLNNLVLARCQEKGYSPQDYTTYLGKALINVSVTNKIEQEYFDNLCDSLKIAYALSDTEEA